MRGPDLNRRPSGYEPDELPGCSTPRPWMRTILRTMIVATPFCPKRLNLLLIDEGFLHLVIYCADIRYDETGWISF
ncbi:hypothetical protein BN1184_BN_00800 [Pantoea ananatis]|nr:hypothetical protein BN1183_CE_00800 [Pantoea ananatis]CRH39639.1 hypothetical protein BN1184_BN_00800 [Pantoea ananatis]